MRQRKRRFWFAVGLLALFLVGGFLWFNYPRPPFGISAQGCAAIRNGMTSAECEAVIGKPPGMYDVEIYEYQGGIPVAIFHSSADWVGPNGAISVYFDEEGLVIGKVCSSNFQRPSLWARILAFVGAGGN
jgi:hypothetical protein